MNDDQLFQDIDFSARYREHLRLSSYRPKSSAAWDARAVERGRRGPDRDYVEAFLSRVDFTGIRTALDIGCGTGNLAIPLAQRLRRVHALDFSAGMLRQLEQNQRAAGVDNLTVHPLSWSDSWRTVPQVDLVLCSRALGVEDLRGALEKMTRWARRRCYATIHAAGDFLGEDIRALLSREAVPRPGYIYAVNILYQMGFFARVDFLKTTGGMAYADVEQFLEAVRWRVGPLDAAEQGRLRKFFRCLPRAADGRRRYRHEFVWALLAWEKPRP